LIEEIANATNEKNKGRLMRTLAIAANTLRWSEMDPHQFYRSVSIPM
jgi:hypothetical protein